jgi:hypothetical protein
MLMPIMTIVSLILLPVVSVASPLVAPIVVAASLLIPVALILVLVLVAAIILTVALLAALLVALEVVSLLHLENALVGVHQIGDLVGQLHGQCLQARRLGTMHHHRFGGVVEGGHQLLVDDHFADERMDLGLDQLEHLGQVGHADRGVHVGVGEQVGAEGLLLDELGQHFANAVGFVEQVPHLDVHFAVDDEVGAGFPVAAAHCFGGGNDVLAHGFGRADQGLALGGAKLLVEGFAVERCNSLVSSFLKIIIPNFVRNLFAEKYRNSIYLPLGISVIQ